MKIGNTTNVGMLFFAALFTPIIYAKYASVNVMMFTLRGNLERGAPFVRVKLLQIMFGLAGFNELSSGNETPIEIVMKQFNNNMPKNTMPFMSELKRDDNAKKLINMNGAKRKPIYTIDCTFNTLIIICIGY